MKNDGGPAFPFQFGPTEVQGFKVDRITNYGMTLRQYYAGQAMMGLLANQNNSKEFSSEISEWAVFHADALLAELAKEE